MMKLSHNSIWMLVVFLCIAGCSKDEEASVQTNFFPVKIEMSTDESVYTINFEYNNANQIKRFTMLSESEMSTGEFEVIAAYENNFLASLVFTNLETEDRKTFTFDHDKFGIITHIDIHTSDDNTYEVSSIYNSYDRNYTFDSDYAAWFPLRYRVDTAGYIFNRYNEDGYNQYTIRSIEGQKGIFHAMPSQTELYLFFELSSFKPFIPYFFSPHAIEKVNQKVPTPDFIYENYEYDEAGNPVNFNAIIESTYSEYIVRYEERPIP